MQIYPKRFKRYIKIYSVLLRLNWYKLFSYRANFVSSLVSHTVWGVFILTSMLLLTSQTSSVAGWTRNELLLLAGVYNIVFSIFYFFFSRNFGELSNIIHFGRLDGILVKPIDSQFLISCTYVGYTHIVRFILGIAFTIIILSQMQLSISLMTVIYFVTFVFISVIILYSIWLSIMTLTLWFTKLSNLADFLYELNGVARYPQEMYKGAGAYILFALFSLTLVIATPVKVLLQKMLIGDIFLPFIFAIGLFWFSRKFWKFALRFYTSASG